MDVIFSLVGVIIGAVLTHASNIYIDFRNKKNSLKNFRTEMKSLHEFYEYQLEAAYDLYRYISGDRKIITMPGINDMDLSVPHYNDCSQLLTKEERRYFRVLYSNSLKTNDYISILDSKTDTVDVEKIALIQDTRALINHLALAVSLTQYLAKDHKFQHDGPASVDTVLSDKGLILKPLSLGEDENGLNG